MVRDTTRSRRIWRGGEAQAGDGQAQKASSASAVEGGCMIREGWEAPTCGAWPGMDR